MLLVWVTRAKPHLRLKPRDSTALPRDCVPNTRASRLLLLYTCQAMSLAGHPCNSKLTSAHSTSPTSSTVSLDPAEALLPRPADLTSRCVFRSTQTWRLAPASHLLCHLDADRARVVHQHNYSNSNNASRLHDRSLELHATRPPATSAALRHAAPQAQAGVRWGGVPAVARSSINPAKPLQLRKDQPVQDPMR